MQRARMLGNYIQQLANEKNISIQELSKMLHCKDYQVKALLKGRAFATFEQMSVLAQTLGVTIGELLKGDAKHYEDSVVHCMNRFQDGANREKILDIIDDYMDIVDAVNR